jgi:hypothetical protein
MGAGSRYRESSQIGALLMGAAFACVVPLAPTPLREPVRVEDD